MEDRLARAELVKRLGEPVAEYSTDDIEDIDRECCFKSIQWLLFNATSLSSGKKMIVYTGFNHQDQYVAWKEIGYFVKTVFDNQLKSETFVYLRKALEQIGQGNAHQPEYYAQSRLTDVREGKLDWQMVGGKPEYLRDASVYYISMNDTAEMLMVHRNTVRRMVVDGRLESHDFGSEKHPFRRILRSSVDAFLIRAKGG